MQDAGPSTMETGCCAILRGCNAPPPSWAIAPPVMKGETPPGSGIFLFSQFPPGDTGPILILSLFYFVLHSYMGILLALSEVQGLLSVFSIYSLRMFPLMYFLVLMYLWQEMSATSCYSILLITPLLIQVIIHLSKPTEHVTQRMNTNANHGLQVTMMCQCCSTNCNICTTVVWMLTVMEAR